MYVKGIKGGFILLFIIQSVVVLPFFLSIIKYTYLLFYTLKGVLTWCDQWTNLQKLQLGNSCRFDSKLHFY